MVGRRPGTSGAPLFLARSRTRSIAASSRAPAPLIGEARLPIRILSAPRLPFSSILMCEPLPTSHREVAPRPVRSRRTLQPEL